MKLMQVKRDRLKILKKYLKLLKASKLIKRKLI